MYIPIHLMYYRIVIPQVRTYSYCETLLWIGWSDLSASFGLGGMCDYYTVNIHVTIYAVL